MADCAELERRITATKAALDGARAGHSHSPNAETQRIVQGVQHQLDAWLDQWAQQRIAEQVVTA